MITYNVHTHIGDREVNEDHVGDSMVGERHCFALADGLGGHGKGECASEMAVKTTLEIFSDDYDEDFIDRCFKASQFRVLEEQKADNSKRDMKTTLVALSIEGKYASWGHIGDSRLYHFRKGKLIRRTLDHSVPQMLVNLGDIKEEDIRGHEDRNRLLRVIGTPWTNKSYEQVGKTKIKSKDAFLLCSDGFWELIDEKTMMKYLRKAKSVDEWMEFMVEEVMMAGKSVNMDNNSAIAIWIKR